MHGTAHGLTQHAKTWVAKRVAIFLLLFQAFYSSKLANGNLSTGQMHVQTNQHDMLFVSPAGLSMCDSVAKLLLLSVESLTLLLQASR